MPMTKSDRDENLSSPGLLNKDRSIKKIQKLIEDILGKKSKVTISGKSQLVVRAKEVEHRKISLLLGKLNVENN